MKNVEMKVDGDKLTIVVDLSKRLGQSSSGKTVVVATTAGNQPIPGYRDTNMKVGLNIYTK